MLEVTPTISWQASCPYLKDSTMVGAIVAKLLSDFGLHLN